MNDTTPSMNMKVIFDGIQKKQLTYMDAVVWMACSANMNDDKTISVSQKTIRERISASQAGVSNSFARLAKVGLLSARSVKSA